MIALSRLQYSVSNWVRGCHKYLWTYFENVIQEGQKKKEENWFLIYLVWHKKQKFPKTENSHWLCKGKFHNTCSWSPVYWFYLIKPYPGDWETQTMLQIMNVLIFKIHQFGGYTGDAINSVTRLGEFWKFLGQFFFKSTQNIKWLLGLFWKAALLWLTLGQSLET